MATTLIVARLREPGNPESTAAISRLFAESDTTELPDLVGVQERSLLTFHDLYFHLVRSDRPLAAGLTPQYANPLFQNLSKAMDEFVTPYQDAWGSVQEASAKRFYHWQRGIGVVRP